METNTTIRIVIDTPDIKIDQDVEVRIKRKIGYWFIHCDSLRSIGFSTVSEQYAIKDLKDNIETFQWVHFKRGTLKEALLKFGWVNTTGDNWEYKTIKKNEILN